MTFGRCRIHSGEETHHEEQGQQHDCCKSWFLHVFCFGMMWHGNFEIWSHVYRVDSAGIHGCCEVEKRLRGRNEMDRKIEKVDVNVGQG